STSRARSAPLTFGSTPRCSTASTRSCAREPTSSSATSATSPRRCSIASSAVVSGAVAVRVAAYTYPWDLARLGVEGSLRDLSEQGVDAVHLAASYHPIDTLSPRGVANVFTSARGAVYFPARGSRYGRIAPDVHSPELATVWSETATRAPGLGLDLDA